MTVGFADIKKHIFSFKKMYGIPMDLVVVLQISLVLVAKLIFSLKAVTIREKKVETVCDGTLWGT